MIEVALGPAPTAVAGANNGTTPPAPVLAAGSADSRGNITFGSGATPAAGAQVVVTHSNAAEYSPSAVVLLTPKNSATWGIGLYVSGQTATGFTISCTNAPGATAVNTTYSVDYVVIP